MKLTGQLSFALIAATLVSLILARFHVFNGYLVFALAFLAAALSPRFPDADRRSVVLGPSLLALVFGAYVFTFATTELDTGRDNGVYNIIAQTSADFGWPKVDASEQFAQDAAAHAAPAELDNYPGTYPGPQASHAQFNHVSALFRAAFVDVFGENEIAISSAVLATLGLFFFSMLARMLVGSWWPFAAILIATNAAVVYVARSALSEVFTVALFCAALLFMIRSIDRRSAWETLTASIAFGCVMLSRVDGYLVASFFPLWVFALLRSNPRDWRTALVALVPATALCVWSIFDLRENSFGYFSDLWPIGLGASFAGAMACLILSGLEIALSIIAPLRFSAMSGFLERLALPLSKAFIAVGFAITVYALLKSVFADQSQYDIYFAFSYIRAPREFTWYTTVPALLISYAGAWLLVRQNGLKGLAFAVPSVLLIVLMLLYTRISPEHPWGARRWVPFSIPLTVLLATVALANLAQYRRQVGLAAGFALLALYLAQQNAMARNWWFVPIQEGWANGYDRLATELRKRGAPYYLTNFSPAASVLTFLKNVPTLPVKQSLTESHVTELTDLPQVCGTYIEPIFGSREEVDWIGSPNQVVERCIQAKIYAPAEVAQVSNKPYRLLAGWHTPEDWGAWTEEPSATLSIRVPDAGKPAKLRIAGMAFLSPQDPTQTVTISIAGQAIGSLNFTAQQPRIEMAFDVPKELSSDSEIIVTLAVAKSYSPRQLGFSTDDRMLGFGLTDIAVDPN
jgi:hypothetical protein